MSTLLFFVQPDIDVIGPRGRHQYLLSRGQGSTLPGICRRRADSLRARVPVKAAKWACVFLFNPIAYFRLICMSCGGALRQTLAVLPDYLATAFFKDCLAMFRRDRTGR